MELKKATGLLKKEIKQEKKKSWKELIESIEPTLSTRQIWTRINSWKKNGKERSNVFNNQDSAERFMALNIKESRTKEQKKITWNIAPKNEFKEEEIRKIITNSKNSAPGINKISYKLLKKLPQTHIIKITELINKVWDELIYPEDWKQVKIIPIPKANKDNKLIENHRGIHLYPTIAKIMSKMIKTRLNIIVNNLGIIPVSSFGFRKGYSTIDMINKINATIEKNKEEKLVSIMVAIDIEKAFDNVNIEKLVDIMMNKKLPKEYINWIHNALTNRRVIMQVEEKTIERITSQSIPQGEPLSPDIFNIYTSDLHEIEKENTDLFQYADDFVIIGKGVNNKEAEMATNKTINNFNEKLDELKLNLNIEKTKYMIIGGKRNNPDMRITIKNQRIIETNEIKILGYILDKKMNFNKHTIKLKNECIAATNIIKVAGNKKGGAHPSTLLNLHKSLIESRIRYSAPMASGTKNLKELQKIINRSLRICMGLTNSTPITAIIAEAGDIPIDLKIETYKFNYVVKKIYQKGITDIKKNRTTKALKELINQHAVWMEKIPRRTMPNIEQEAEESKFIKIDIKLHEILKDKKNMNTALWKPRAIEHIKKYDKIGKIYTDGSIINGNRGIGIYNEVTKESYSYRIDEEISIKTLEALAIEIAINKTEKDKLTKIAIFTDSLSTCKALNNKNTEHKYYEQNIKNSAANKKIETIIVWIPSHIGIIGNEEADKAAKYGAKSNRKINIKLSVEESIRIFKNIAYDRWATKFLEETINKGKQHKDNINGRIKDKPWFYKRGLEADLVKMITRVRTNHSFDAKYFKLIKKIDNDECEVCDTTEDARHIIKRCIKHDDIRRKYKILEEKSLQTILSEGRTEEYRMIYLFLKEVGVSL